MGIGARVNADISTSSNISTIISNNIISSIIISNNISMSIARSRHSGTDCASISGDTKALSSSEPHLQRWR